ncbi:MAG: IS3 family transposase [Nitrospiria bacterium]
MRKSYSSKFKAKVAIEAIKEDKTMAELSSIHGVHRVMIQRWKNEAIAGLTGVFTKKTDKHRADDKKLIGELYRQIGQLTVENEWIKKSVTLPTEKKRSLIKRNPAHISINKQCVLLSLSKGALYYKPIPMDAYTLRLMDLIDKQYMETPFYGSRKMLAYLNHIGHRVNRKRVQRLMRLMGIEALYPKRNLSKRRHDHKIYPYLLKGMTIDRPNLVWSADITYIRLKTGFLYLMAIIDWYSRYILSWRLSNSLESEFCKEAVIEALKAHPSPEIFNTDQGCQFTSETFLSPLLARDIKISMDSKGRALDNIFVERFWRSLKYEEVYLRDYETVHEASNSIDKYFVFYNTRRFHQSLGYKTPHVIHFC